MELEKENPTDKKWYAMNEEGEINGPFNTFELDKLFQDQTLTKKFRIKQRGDDSYHFLGRYVKRYYK